MRRLIGVITLTAGLATPSVSLGYFDTGNDLYDRCRQVDSISKAICIATVSGALDMMTALGYKCSLDATVTREQMKDVTVKYLQDHPATRNQPAVFSIFIAMKESFGCKLAEPEQTRSAE